MDSKVFDILNNEREETTLPSAPPDLDPTKSFFKELEIEEGVSPLIEEMQKFEEDPEQETFDEGEYEEVAHETEDFEEPSADRRSDYGHASQGAQSLGEDDFEGFGELVADFVGTVKDLLDVFFDKTFQEKLDKEFDSTERKTVDLMVFLDNQGILTYENQKVMEDWAAKYETDLPTLISLWVRYTRIRKRYQSTPYRENYKALIEKYTYRTLKKYWGEANQIGPEWILVASLISVLGFDLARLLWNKYSDRKKKPT